MTNIERERLAALEREAEALHKVWMREREEQRAMQVNANAEIRRRWVESDLGQGEPRTTEQRSVTAEQTGRRFHRSRPRK